MRLELFFKTAGELQALLALVRQNGIGALNLVNKAKADPLLDQIRTIKAVLPHVDVVPHYSLKYQYRNGSADLSFEAARDFCSKAAAEGVREVLLVSGSGPKKQLDAVSCLERFAAARKRGSSAAATNAKKKKRPREEEDNTDVCEDSDSSSGGALLDRLSFGVAYNPYLSEAEGLLLEEQRRLKAKLATGLVSSVWLQLGTDPQRLRKGLAFLQAEAAGRDPPLRVVGSLAVPSRKFLAMMKFRPWGGVCLTEEYLSSVESADAVTRRILDVYREFDVEPIVETAVASQADLARVKELVGEDLYFPPLAAPPAPSSSSPSAAATTTGKEGDGEGTEGVGMETRARKKGRSA